MLRFPELASNKLYTSAESCRILHNFSIQYNNLISDDGIDGGHYMPEIAQYILNEKSNPTTTYTTELNFGGFLVGNPFTDHNSEYPAMFYTYYGHQLLSKPSWERYQKNCNKKFITQINATECELIEISLGLEVGDLNPYAVDYPTCVDDTSSTGGKGSRAQMIWALNYMLPDYMKEVIMPTTQEAYEPCADNYMVTYLNRLDVKTAIHVDTSIDWEECSSNLHYNMADRLIPMMPIYKNLLESDYGLNILVSVTFFIFVEFNF